MNATIPLPEAEVLSCVFTQQVEPHMPALRLRWPDAALTPRLWNLPAGDSRLGPPPTQFGIVLRRIATDRYYLRLIWNDHYMDWRHLRRQDIRETCIGSLLQAIGTNLEDMLDQPLMPLGARKTPMPPTGRAA